MKKVKFKNAIRIGDDVTEIMKLRCVNYVTKCPPFIEGRYAYYLYPGLMWDYKEDLSHCYIAWTGNWLCEDTKNLWHILTNEEYEKHIEDSQCSQRNVK